MVEYNPALLKEHADSLYTRALKVILGYAMFGAALGFGISTFLPIAELKIVFGVFGAIAGFFIGQGKAFALKLQTQLALCQLQIEINTRKEKEFSPMELKKIQASLSVDALILLVTNSNIKEIEYLASTGTNFNQQNTLGRTALMAAAAMGDLNMCKLLVDNGADSSFQDTDGRTALSEARQYKNSAVVSYFQTKN